MAQLGTAPIVGAADVASLRPGINSPEWRKEVRRRLRRAAGDRTYRQIAADTGAHPETVRRYLTKGTPCAGFIAAICDAYGVSADWILTGRAPCAASTGMTTRVVLDLTMSADRPQVLPCSAAALASQSGARPEPGRSTAALEPAPRPVVGRRGAGR